MDNKKEIRRRKYCIVFKNGFDVTLSADCIELDDRYAGDERLRLFNKKENGFCEIATFNFENIAGWYEVENCESEDNKRHG